MEKSIQRYSFPDQISAAGNQEEWSINVNYIIIIIMYSIQLTISSYEHLT